ncbi:MULTISPECIES: hypothetical protein [Streptomyces phaeochromogenes group]|uniref:hypothetical protein n=1 Tax=Streptomyces phaeochromogenes group TaxID=2838332 RepID=UPI0033EB5EE1|nr:hypothetical protein OHB08_50870 [Streptomyces phaeochromogenes]
MDFAYWPALLVVDVEGNETNPPDLVEVAALPVQDGAPDKSTAKAWLTRVFQPDATGGEGARGEMRLSPGACGWPAAVGGRGIRYGHQGVDLGMQTPGRR